MIYTDDEGYATPGDWYTFYRQSWEIAFPTDDLKKPGEFLDDRWHSATPAWDKWWFESYGVKPPKYREFPGEKEA
jgi:hypothetical protein